MLDVTELCNKYKFTFEIIGETVKVKSGSNVWYIKESKHIDVYHESFFGRKPCHKQRFPKSVNNVERIFQYISNHEHKNYPKLNSVFRTKYLLESVMHHGR